MADKKITALTSMGVSDPAGEDFLHIIDYGGGSSPVNKKVNLTNLFSQLNLDTTIYGASKTFEIGFGAASNSALKVATAASATADATVTINDDGNAYTDFLVKSDASDSALKVDAGANTVTVNGDGVDVDFTVNGLNVNKLIHADAGTDVVGIGVATPDTAYTLDVAATGTNAIKAAGAVTITGALSTTTNVVVGGSSAGHLALSSVESLTANTGAANHGTIGVTTTLVTVTGTCTGALPNSTVPGQIKILTCVARSAGTYTNTPATMNGFSSFAFDAAGDSIVLIWTAAGWAVIATGESTTLTA